MNSVGLFDSSSTGVEHYLIAPEVVEELTEQEECDRHRLELRVERAFVEAGAER